MKAVVCVKSELDVTGPFSCSSEIGELDYQGVVRIMNPADVSALALISKAARDGDEIIAITVGPGYCDEVLRQGLTMGATSAIRIWDKRLEQAAPAEYIARILACAAKGLGADIIVCGSGSLVSDGGATGPFVAEFLGFSQLSHVVSCEIEGERLKALCKLAHGNRESVSCGLPVCMIVDAGTEKQRYASLDAMIQAQRSEIPVWDYATLEFEPPFYPFDETISMGFCPPRPRAKRNADSNVSGMSKKDRMRQLAGMGKKAKASSVLEGSPDEVADGMVDFLKSLQYI